MDRSSVRFLGTGTAFNHAGRRSQSFLVRAAGQSPFLVDAGPTVMVPLMQEGSAYDEIDRLFVTHLHGDHTAGWPFLLLHLVILARRRRPFDVWGPPGTRETLEGLAGLCYREVFEMREFDLRYHELPVAVDNGVAVGSGLVLDTLPMRHHPSSIGLRFRLAGSGGDAVVAVSGDTGWCDNLERLARGCDLLLLECTSVEPLTDVHISLRELRDKADRLDATRIVLVHLDDAVAADLSLDPIPRVGAATDDLTIEFP